MTFDHNTYIFGELISYIIELVQSKHFHPKQNSYKMIFTKRKAYENSLTRVCTKMEYEPQLRDLDPRQCKKRKFVARELRDLRI